VGTRVPLRDRSGSINNSAGNLALHIIGGLNHFLGRRRVPERVLNIDRTDLSGSVGSMFEM